MEEIDLIFAEAYSDPSLGGYVKHSQTRPHVTGRQLDVELANALRIGKIRQQEGDIEHLENVGGFGEKRGPMRRLNSEKAGAGLKSTETNSSNESSTGTKGETKMREFV